MRRRVVEFHAGGDDRAAERKRTLSSEQALALAEAMDTVIEKAQLVTVPILDSRMAVVDSRFADVDRRFAQIDVRFERMEALFEKVGARFEKVDARFDAVNSRIDHVEGGMKTGFEAIDIRFKVWSLRIILATVLSQAALGPVGLSALELAKRILSAVLH
jgi:hypothetical protein